MVQLELLNQDNEKYLLQIYREDTPTHFVEEIEDTIALSKYGTQNHLHGHCYAIKYQENYVGIILIGEAIEDDADPKELMGRTYFRILGFVIDSHYRNQGIGSKALRMSMENICNEYGRVAFLLECHKDNLQALRFYEKQGFRNTELINAQDGNYYLIKE